MIRPPLSLLAASAAVVLGISGLVGGAMLDSSSSEASSAHAHTGIVISGAYVREPASPTVAAAYFTVFNTTNRAEVLTDVSTGAGQEAALHTDVGDTMQVSAAGLTIPAHGRVSLSPGKGHVMITKLYGPLLPGQTVNLELTFQTAGVQVVTAPVIAITALAPVAVAP